MADKTETAAFVYVAPAAAHAFAKSLIASYGVPDADAETVARCLVQADLRGVDTHGLMRLPGYLNRVRLGLTNKTPKLEAKPVGTAAAVVDGQNGFGFVVGTFAMNEAIRLAGLHGVGIVAARHSTHFGMAASYVLQALDAGYVSMVFSNASPAMPPWGARDAMLGTSPFAAGAPAGERDAFLLDMSPAVAARGKIRRALRRGQTIPEGYALDAQGRSTTDPAAALDGVVLPIGGPKGSGISMLADVLCGVIGGAAFAGGVGDQYKAMDRPQDVGHFFFAMKPDLFVPQDQYKQRMDALVDKVHAAPAAEGFADVQMPGEPETRHEALRRRGGIPYSRGEVAELQKEAATTGIAPLAVSDQPLDHNSA
jgi:LDH2 family malate/lactate/ureidoglycolate dehydrogenase